MSRHPHHHNISARLGTTLALTFLALVISVIFAGPARAEFGFSLLETYFKDSVGQPVTQAGSHPAEYTTDLAFKTKPNPLNPSQEIPDEEIKDIFAELPPGLVGDPTAVPDCPTSIFFNTEATSSDESCPDDSAVGFTEVLISDTLERAPVYNLEHSFGAVAKLGFIALGFPVTLEIVVNPDPPYNYNVVTKVTDIYQVEPLFSTKLVLWGDPADSSHDEDRGDCAFSPGACPTSIPERAFLTMPRSCTGPLDFTFNAFSWQSPAEPVTEVISTPDMTNCAGLGFDPDVAASPTTPNAASPSGFDFSIDIDDPGLIDPDNSAESDIKRVVVTLPEGVAVNPSSADGLGVCTPAQLAAESPSSDFGAGCPGDSKIATVGIASPLVQENLAGSLFLAAPYDNPFGSLLAGYLVIKSEELGIAVKLAGKIETDPSTGQIVASFDDNPQLPFSDLDVSFKIGNRAPLVTPPTCGAYEVKTELFPWSGNPPLTKIDSFTIDRGPDGGGCLGGNPAAPGNSADAAALPFSPSFDAGTKTPIAAAFSPLVAKLSRPDGVQPVTGLDLDLPQGLTGKLAGVGSCPDSALAAAASRSGGEEQAAPSCPAQSRVGVVTVGAGAGPTPFHTQGTVYLAGPYKGAPISFAVITPAVAGPFDLGTVVVRAAARIDPRTAQIHVASDAVPQILAGIPLQVRSLVVDTDRPGFTLNPTSCDPMSVNGSIFGAPSLASVSSPFQVAECTRLGFRPRVAFRLKGGTRRGGHPALTAVIAPRPGDANIARVSVSLPRSEFLDQSHIETICTRVQFAADQCPARAIYGAATVTTALLDYPLGGPVYLRSSSNLLPDLVPDLRGPAHQPIRIESAGRTDSIRKGIRNTFDFVPDAPFTRLVVKLKGGRKGLLINSRDICKRTYRAKVRFRAHNGDTFTALPPLKVKCPKKKAKKRGDRKGRGR
jgi:hypothetical protein